jgi:hypothetical protein
LTWLTYDATLFLYAQADAENRPIYLESSSLKNNTYYAKFGFEMKRDISFKRGGVPVVLYIMVREPQPRKLTYSASIRYEDAGMEELVTLKASQM